MSITSIFNASSDDINSGMNKKIFVCFTCSRDLPLLEAHYAAIMLHDPSAVVYYIFEDNDDAQGPVGSRVVTAGFPHNGNLIGLQCHYGMLTCMKQLSAKHDNADVVKIDADCYYLNDYEGEYDLVGTAPGNGYYCKGCCYKISYNCICKVIDYIFNGYVDVSGRCEDHIISMISAIVSEPNKVKIFNAYDLNENNEVTEVNSCIFQRGYYNEPEPLSKVKNWIDCGDSKYTKEYTEANLPVPLAKARALEFILNYLQKSSPKV